jgi:hypothetical protein
MMRVLHGLPSNYNNLRTVLNSRFNELTKQSLLAQLKDHEMFLKSLQPDLGGVNYTSGQCWLHRTAEHCTTSQVRGVKLGDGSTKEVKGMGKVVVTRHQGKTLVLSKAHYMPELHSRLLPQSPALPRGVVDASKVWLEGLEEHLMVLQLG